MYGHFFITLLVCPGGRGLGVTFYLGPNQFSFLVSNSLLLTLLQTTTTAGHPLLLATLDSKLHCSICNQRGQW